MKLEIMQRTMQALADMDIAVALKVMGIAESMAEQFPRSEKSVEIDRARLRPHSYEVQLPVDDEYVTVKTTIEPSFGHLIQMSKYRTAVRVNAN